MQNLYSQKERIKVLYDIQKANIELRATGRRIQGMKRKFLGNIRYRKKIAKLQALEESQRDILNTAITQSQSTDVVVDKNNYRTYSKQVETMYAMYNAETEYGNEYLRGLVDLRVSLIGGNGISIASTKKKTEDYIHDFLKTNKLDGSFFINVLEQGEIEGRCFLILYPDQKLRKIKVLYFSWKDNSYNVVYKNGEFQKVTYHDEAGNEKIITNEKAVYIRLGGTLVDLKENTTTNKIHTVLTDIENASRAKYDLRKNSHLFGKSMPYWQTETRQQAASINNDIAGDEWVIGKGYAGSASFSYVEPTGGATDVVTTDQLASLRAIALTLGVPIHWLSYPELMSNRATAENMMELVTASTKKDRLIWQEGFEELIRKSMAMAIDNGFFGNEIIDDFEVVLPVVSLALLKSMIEAYLPLMNVDILSKTTVRNHVPGIDPLREKRLIEKEKKEAMEKAIDNNFTLDNRLNEIQNSNKEKESNNDNDANRA